MEAWPRSQEHKETAASRTKDYSIVKPIAWDEVISLHEALEISRSHFLKLTGQIPPQTELWTSYRSQLNELKSHLKTFPRVQAGRRTTSLHSRGEWTVNIKNWKAAEEIQIPASDLPTHASQTVGLDSTEQGENEEDLNDTPIPEAADTTQGLLDAEISGGWEVGSLSSEQEMERSSEHDRTMTKKLLNDIVVADWTTFLTWLASHGREGYQRYNTGHEQISWSEYCRWIAPTDFQLQQDGTLPELAAVAVAEEEEREEEEEEKEEAHA